MNYQKEQKDWDHFIVNVIGDGAKLLSVSVSSSDCRVYSAGTTTFKIKRLTPASIRGKLNSLEDEFLIMYRLETLPNTPTPLGYKRSGEWELLEMTTIPSLPIYDPTFDHPRESLKDFLRIVTFVWSMNRLGCSHGDLHFQNIGNNIDGSLSVFDFDQACIAKPLHCFLRDFLGVGPHARATDVSLIHRLRKVQIIWPIVTAFILLKRFILKIIRGCRCRRGESTLAQMPVNARTALLKDENLNMLAEAWSIGASSNASSPGLSLAYYSIDVCGVNFPGERPWVLRWNCIQSKINFKGKKFLELGCNLGLLATHANLNGAAACLGVDIDKDIVRAASLASRAFGAEVKFRQLDLDDPHPWEDELDGYDVISALSVMHWVKNKRRVWSFLGQHKEIIYEGHESDIDAEENLRKVGFTQISSIGQSERGRQVFYAFKLN